MSDADGQMGGQGGSTGLDPAQVTPGKENSAPTGPSTDPEGSSAEDDEADESSKESFPASDPPANY